MHRLLIVLTVLGCAAPEVAPRAAPDLERAADEVGDMLVPRNLSRSAFYAAFPDGRPSDFVDYLFSEMGAAEWPDPEVWGGVRVVPLRVDPSAGRQVVVRHDDARDVIVVHGYGDPDRPPELAREWPLPRVAPSELASLALESNRDLGIRVRRASRAEPAPAAWEEPILEAMRAKPHLPWDEHWVGDGLRRCRESGVEACVELGLGWEGVARTFPEDRLSACVADRAYAEACGRGAEAGCFLAARNAHFGVCGATDPGELERARRVGCRPEAAEALRWTLHREIALEYLDDFDVVCGA